MPLSSPHLILDPSIPYSHPYLPQPTHASSIISPTTNLINILVLKQRTKKMMQKINPLFLFIARKKKKKKEGEGEEECGTGH